MENSPIHAELAADEIEVIQELEQALSHVKGRRIALVAYDLGDDEDAGTDDYDISATPAP